jgi:Peptidase family M28
MTPLALPLVAAAAALLPDVRPFWTVAQGPQLQPTQTQVRARLVREGRWVAVYQEEGYRFSTVGEADEAAQIAAAVTTFDEVIYPQEVALFGSCPDLDANGKVILLITRLTRTQELFFPFDEMLEEEALRYGFHSNQGEILYHTFGEQGNRANWNIRGLAETFHRLLHYSHDATETAWSTMLSNYMPFMCGLASARLLWGDLDPDGRAHAPADPWTERGWSLLFVQYLRDQLGPEGLRDLVARPETGVTGLSRLLAEQGDRRTPADLIGDFAMACWLDDASFAGGRFGFASVVPPRPLPAARPTASRPTSGVVEVGVGGMAFLVVEGDGERSFPLALQGDPSTRWVGRAVELRRVGPDRELPLEFSPDGVARFELPDLAVGDAVVVAVAAVPGEYAMFDQRTLLLRWGVGWVPHVPVDQSRGTLAALVKKAIPDGGEVARTRLAETVDLLSGAAVPGAEVPPVSTRYAWAPASAAVADVLEQEAGRRGLKVRRETFVHRAPNDIQQEWTNVVVHLPGSDPRRWPVVLAAHWDGARGDLADSYLRALNLNDNASGVAVALEAAGAMSRRPHRAPIIVAFLAGGYQEAAGARALLESLGGKISAWIELDGVGVPERWPRSLNVHLEGGGRMLRFPSAIHQELRRAGLVAKDETEITAPHTGGRLVAARGISALVVRTRMGDEAADLDTPPAVERQRLSPDLMVLLTKVLAGTALNLAGVP